jgi:putative effector of murein hydrolase
VFWFEAAQELAVAAGKAKARSMGSVNHGLGVARVFYWGELC